MKQCIGNQALQEYFFKYVQLVTNVKLFVQWELSAILAQFSTIL